MTKQHIQLRLAAALLALAGFLVPGCGPADTKPSTGTTKPSTKDTKQVKPPPEDRG
jgi:hypothetical protein